MADNTATTNVELSQELVTYLSEIAKSVQVSLTDLITRLVFDGLAFNVLQDAVESRGLSLETVVVDAIKRVDEQKESLVDKLEDFLAEQEENDESVELHIAGNNGEDLLVDVDLDETDNKPTS